MKLRMIVVLAFLVSACEGEAVAPPQDGAPGPSDGGRTEVDAGAAREDASVAMAEVSFSAPPAAVQYVRGSVALQIVVRGGQAGDEVELWKDGAVLVVLASPYSYTWDTEHETETAHVLEARVVRGGAVVARAERSFVVDRTPPRVVSRSPEPGTPAALADPIVVTFSEPILPPSLTGATEISLGGMALAHAVALPSPDRVELRLEAAPALPATVTVTLGAPITDLAGNALAADAPWSLTFPLWIERPALATSAPVRVFDATLGPDGSVWVVYERTIGPSAVELLAARWDGARWTELSPLRSAANLYDARIRLRPSGRALVAWSAASDVTYEVGLRELDGTSWVALAAPPRADELAYGLDFEIEADGALVIARRIDTDYFVHRYRGSWSPVGSAIPALTAGGFHTDLLPTPTGLAFAYITEYDCSIVRESAAGWTSAVTVHNGTGVHSQCSHMWLATSPDGTLHGFVGRREWVDRYSSVPSTTVMVETHPEAWTRAEWLPSPLPRWWLNVVTAEEGFYALGELARPGVERRVYDASLMPLDGAFGEAVRVLARGREPLVVTSAPSVIERNVMP